MSTYRAASQLKIENFPRENKDHTHKADLMNNSNAMRFFYLKQSRNRSVWWRDGSLRILIGYIRLGEV